MTLQSSSIGTEGLHNENSLLSHFIPEEFAVRFALSTFASTPLILDARGCYRYMHYNLCRFSSWYRGLIKPVVFFIFLLF